MKFLVRISPPDPLTSTRIGMIWPYHNPIPLGWFAMTAMDYAVASLYVGNLIREQVLGGGPGEIRAIIQDTGDTIQAEGDELA